MMSLIGYERFAVFDQQETKVGSNSLMIDGDDC